MFWSKAVVIHSGGPCNSTMSATIGCDVEVKVDSVSCITVGARSDDTVSVDSVECLISFACDS